MPVGSELEPSPRPMEVSQRLDSVISKAVWEFAQEREGWEAHVRYHDEPIWLLRKDEGGKIERIQVAVFDGPDGPTLYVIPDKSDLVEDARRDFRLNRQKTIFYKEWSAYDSTKLENCLRDHLTKAVDELR